MSSTQIFKYELNIFGAIQEPNQLPAIVCQRLFSFPKKSLFSHFVRHLSIQSSPASLSHLNKQSMSIITFNAKAFTMFIFIHVISYTCCCMSLMLKSYTVGSPNIAGPQHCAYDMSTRFQTILDYQCFFLKCYTIKCTQD